MNEQYHGKNHVHIASRAGMRITHISQSFLPTSCSHPLHLKYVLHVPSITRNLLSVFFCLYNNVLFDFNSQYFFVKDRDTREVTSCSCFCSLTFLEWCFFTSCFLINWLPSLVINIVTPPECLLGEVPDYTFLRLLASHPSFSTCHRTS
jgi:hypothetical protein